MQRITSEIVCLLRIVVVSLVMSIVLVSCSKTNDSHPKAQNFATQLQPLEFEESTKSDNVFVLNVHTPDEGSLPGTDAAIPFDEIKKRASELPVSQKATMAVYCRSGRMSRTAVETLVEMGYTDLVELSGGMNAWSESGRPLLPATRN